MIASLGLGPKLFDWMPSDRVAHENKKKEPEAKKDSSITVDDTVDDTVDIEGRRWKLGQPLISVDL